MKSRLLVGPFRSRVNHRPTLTAAEDVDALVAVSDLKGTDLSGAGSEWPPNVDEDHCRGLRSIQHCDAVGWRVFAGSGTLRPEQTIEGPLVERSRSKTY